MAIKLNKNAVLKLNKNAVAEVDVTHKAKGQVLTQVSGQEVVETPPYTQPDTLPDEAKQEFEDFKEAVMGHVDDGVQTTTIAPYCEVGFEASMTHNLGNYESAKVTVSIKIPCLVPEIDEAFEYAKNWVDQKMNLVNAEVKGE